MASKVIKIIEGKLAGKSFQSLLQMRGKFGSAPSARLYKKEVLRAAAESDPNMHKAIYGGSFDPHVAGKTFTKALQHVHNGEGKLELTEKARRMLGLKKDQELKGGKEEMVTKKLVTFFRKEAADAAPKTDEKTPEELLREKRVERARRGMNLYQTQKERAEIESGKKMITPTSITTGQEKKSATSATSHEGAGTIAGASRAAGSDAAKPSVPIPGQHETPPSRGVVPLMSIGLHSLDGRPADRTDDIAIPRIGIAKEEPGTEKTVPTPGLKTEVTDIRPGKDADDELPSTKDIDQNLPLAA